MEATEELGLTPKNNSFTAKVKTWWLNHPWMIRLYLGGITCVCAHIALHLRSPNSTPSNVALYASCTLLAIAFLGDTYAWVKPRLGHIFIKILVSVLGAIALSAATGVGRIMVNQATHQQASLFPVSSALLTLLSVVPVIATLLATLGAIPTFIFLLWGIFKPSKPKAPNGQLDAILSTARCIAAFVVIFGAFVLSSNSSPIYPAMRWIAAYSAFFFDLQKDDACAPLEDDRVSRINDSLVIIGRITQAGPQFVRKVCLLQAEATVLAPPRASIATPKPASKSASLE